MYRDLWTGLIPTVVAVAAVFGIGAALDWSNATLGWAFLGTLAVVISIWSLTRPRHRER
ncbi:MAG: hypothetical protein ACRDL6_07765 [Solirubrobacterales bacterium]